jgi:hypothetical protein
VARRRTDHAEDNCHLEPGAKRQHDEKRSRECPEEA